MSLPARSASLLDSPAHGRVRVDTTLPKPPTSIISSHATDFVSEDGDEYYPEGAAAAAAQSKAKAKASGAVAAPSNLPAQFSQNTLPQRELWSSTPPSRNWGTPVSTTGQWRPTNAFGGSGISMSNTSRPQSSASRSSRTHMPSVSSHAFFRPMSSQRLQAQRGVRPTTGNQSIISTTNQSEVTDPANRRSVISNQTGQSVNPDLDQPPPSRGTEFTENDPRDRATANASPDGHHAKQSVDGSIRPLHQKPSTVAEASRGGSSYKVGGLQVNGQQSTGSFRSSFLLPQRDETPIRSPTRSPTQGHQRLSSDATLPKSHHSHDKEMPKLGAGLRERNYKYFSGNTRFWFGGRFQNTRDRPINIATGILVVLPCCLFLAYS